MAAYTSVQAGDFNDDATWGGGGHPTSSGDTATIGHAITASAGITCGAITINAGGSLDTGTSAATITSITTASTGACTIGSGGCTFAGVLNNAGSGTLTINGACTGVTDFTPNTCGMNAAVTMSGTMVGPASGRTLTQGPVTLSGMTAGVAAFVGKWTVAAGGTISFNSASAMGLTVGTAGTFTTSGVAGNLVTITNAGAGTATVSTGNGLSNLNYTDVKGSVTLGADGCSIKCVGVQATGITGIVSVGRLNIDGFYSTGAFHGGVSLVTAHAQTRLRNIIVGYSRDGTASAPATGITPGNVNHLANAIINATTQVATPGRGIRSLSVDNLGHVAASWLPGTGSALDLAVADAGVGKTWFLEGTIERQTANPPSGKTYHIRLTPNANLTGAADSYLEVYVSVPVKSGDNISVTAKASRSGDSSDCADVVIDPEGAWFTPTTVAWDLTNADTYYDLPTCAATGAGGTGAKGTVRVVFRMKEYSASQYLDIGDITITCGGTAYVVSCANWANGMPVPDEPAAGGGSRAVIIGG